MGFAYLRGGRPRPWHFGLRATPVKRTLAITAAATVLVLGFEIGFAELVGVDEADTDELGTDEGFVPAARLLAGGDRGGAGGGGVLLPGVLLPRAAQPAAGVVGLPDHVAGVRVAAPPVRSRNPLVFVIIGVFAVGACLVYEATGNLFTVIAIHAIFNTLATAGTDAGYVVPIAVGAAVVAACVRGARAGSARRRPRSRRSALAR